ncbi:2-C-methyl-D-erythritol 4-phosphate cytidylyltransferase [Candidatus Sumerlaeota bacterium]|nr:2-C-methyl-D-erythritol 4-phosphate cytidylyltransferase [Candidatus Sumerlaeota bacterium]
MMPAAVIIVAGGQGQRFGSELPKQFLSLAGKPVLLHSLERFDALERVVEIVLVLPECWLNRWREQVDVSGLKKSLRAVAGGAKRQDSVWNGLMAVESDTPLIVVHDAVRPLTPTQQIETALQCAERHGAAILAAPCSDTLKQTDGEDSDPESGGVITQTLDRSRIWRAQTPQAARRDWLLAALEHARNSGIAITDESQALELDGRRVRIVESNADNLKITTRHDLQYAEWLLRQSPINAGAD